jgi:hypothetical protein
MMRETYLGTTRRDRTLTEVLMAVVVVGLALDAYVHLHLASAYDGIRTSSISQGDLFRVEAVLAIIAALALAFRPRRYTAGFAFLVATGGVFAVLLYQYVNVGKIGPIPDMYDPIWSTEKVLSLIGEAAAAVAALSLLAVMQWRIRQAKHSSSSRPTPTPVPPVVA